jgi:hypothetical protein
MSNAFRDEVFQFLTDLRESGEVNMMEAPNRLMSKFNFSPEESKTYFWEWTQSLKQD